MEKQVNGHTMRGVRAEKLWEKWAHDFYIKGLGVSEIQKKYPKENSMHYAPEHRKYYSTQYIYQKMAIVKDRIINS